MNTYRSEQSQQGFTIVEVVVTLVILTLFLIGFFQSYLLLESQRINVFRQAKASDIAYINLSKYPGKPANLDCVAGDTVLGSTKTGRTTSAYNFVAEQETNLLGTSSQEVIASAPSGCDTTTTPAKFKDGLVKITSTVEYSGNRSITHVTYVK